jgi:hypothetical protein
MVDRCSVVQDERQRFKARVTGDDSRSIKNHRDAIGVARPNPAGVSTETNDYVFERKFEDPGSEGSVSHRRIDLYKKNCFVLEAKQSRQKGGQEGGSRARRSCSDRRSRARSASAVPTAPGTC